ncbi:hypothetical protein [Actinoplanes siamensis]|uniref:hypothetical protein n=1 Tax=Actinoplanes siamensis TaxID=1223317 RepID=UPI00361BAE01
MGFGLAALGQCGGGRVVFGTGPVAGSGIQRQAGLHFGDVLFPLVLIGRWKTLRHATISPRRIGDIVAAALHLTHFEYRYLPRSC